MRRHAAYPVRHHHVHVNPCRIPDLEATKPDDWDEDAPRTIPDADAVKPEGWLDDEPTEVPDECAWGWLLRRMHVQRWCAIIMHTRHTALRSGGQAR